MTMNLEHLGAQPDRSRRQADPIAAILTRLHDDPTIADLIALRESKPDLCDAAVKAEAHRDAYGWAASQADGSSLARIALLTIAGAHAMIVAIFPAASVDDVDAKVALQPSREWLATWQGSGDFARGRIALAAFNPGQTTVPAPEEISIRESALYPWPPRGFDLATEIDGLANRQIYTHEQFQVLAAFAREGLDMKAVLEKARDYFNAADRLLREAMRLGPMTHQTRLAAEGALIAAYLSCGQIAVWPARRGTRDRDAKLAMQALVNWRATTADPLHMQAAVRHGATFTGTVARGAPHLFVEAQLGEWTGNV
jgi:hypothetical protein